MIYPVIGELSPNARELGPPTGFQKFESPLGVHGLARVDGKEIHFLAVAAVTPGIGQFRTFFHALQKEYDFIRMWAVLDDSFRRTLASYGFKKGHDVDRFGVMQEVWDFKWMS